MRACGDLLNDGVPVPIIFGHRHQNVERCFRQRQEIFYFNFAITHTMSIASVDINVQGKIRTLSRSLPCERLLADLGPQEVDLYREEKAEAGPERQRTRGFHPTFTRFCASSIRREERLLFARVFPLRACWLIVDRSTAASITQFTVHRAIMALSSMTGRSPPPSVPECPFQAAPRCEYHRLFPRAGGATSDRKLPVDLL